jgi:hypothetical protein
MKQKKNDILKSLSSSWKSFTRYITPVFSIGAIMVIASVFLIAFPNGLLQAAGTAMLAAGLTIITTTLTNKESIRQQFAKDANITRKDTIYGPLFIELKQIYDWLDEAKKKEERYPFYIYGVGGEPDSTRYLRNTSYPTFLQWPQFKQDYRIDNFTHGARTLLDETQQLIVDYNIAMGKAMNPAVIVLAVHIEKAISAWMGSNSFKDWDKRSSGGRQQQPDQFHKWNSYLKTLTITSASLSSDMSIEIAKTWLGFHGGLGWLVADNRDKAAIAIKDGYLAQSSDLISPDLSWFQEILTEAWPEIDSLQEIKEARMVAEKLHIKVREVENLLESGIRFIRDQYEGGEPPI